MKTESSFSRNLEMLSVVSEFPEGVAFSEIQQRCASIPKATLVRQLKSLVAEALLTKCAQSGRYHVGDNVRLFASKILRSTSRQALVQPVLDALAQELHESVAYFELDGDAVMLLGKRDMPDSWHFLPVHGRNEELRHVALLTILSRASANVVDRFVGQRSLSAAESAEFRRKLTDFSETPALNAKPVFQEDGTIVGAIVVSHLSTTLDTPLCQRAAESAARQIQELFAAYRVDVNYRFRDNL